MIKFAVLSFPGTNCEVEAVRAFHRNGMEADIVLWNDHRLKTEEGLKEFDGYCIAGGFSYEDRGRSGVVAAQDLVMEVIRQEADRGKIVLGICNGAQILVESGLVPGFSNHALGMSLAWNEMRQNGEVVDTGFYNAWCYLKNTASRGRTAFNQFDELLHIPFAHGEGRFVIPADLLQKLEENGQLVFKYANAQGQVDESYPITPNGAMKAIAAVCNPAGNVMAIMPHPERDPKGNGNAIFSSIRQWLELKHPAPSYDLGPGQTLSNVRPMEVFDVEIFVRLIITDNTERTLEEAIRSKGMPATLRRFEFFGLRLKSGQKATPEFIESIIKSAELANLNKHQVFVRTSEGTFVYSKEKGLIPKVSDFDPFVLVAEQEDTVGERKRDALNRHVAERIDFVRSGVLWQFVDTPEGVRQQVMDSYILYNPYSMYMMKQ